jgi:hypothetical protein
VGEALHRSRVARRRERALRRAHRVAARLHHRIERLALVLQVALDRFDQVRNQVVAAPELNVDLRERVLETVTQHHQAVVDGDRPYRCRDRNREDDPDPHSHGPMAPVALCLL